MAVIPINRPLRAVDAYRLFPASYYARPALAPMPVYSGVRTQQVSTQALERTLKQMAVSPFVVNDQAYMERIRNQYGFNDEQHYKTMGLIGGFIGAGLGAAYGAGYLGLRGFIKYNKTSSIFNKNFWTKANFGGFQSPVSLSNTFKPKRQVQHDFFFNKGVSKEVWKNSENARNVYSNITQTLADLKDKQALAQKTLQEANDNMQKAIKHYDSIKYNTKNISKAERETARVARNKAVEGVEDAKKIVSQYADDVSDKSKEALDAIKDLKDAKVVDDAFEVGQEVSRKAGGAAPWIGLGLDLANLAASASALKQSIEEGHTLGTVVNSITTLGDTLAVVGDVLEFTPFAPVGAVVSWIGSGLSVVMSAVGGFLLGQTVGHSLTPTGLKAQQMFAENLYMSTIQRPITSIASAWVMLRLPAQLGSLAAAKRGSLVSRLGVRSVASWFTETTSGAFGRSMLSMLTLQALSPITTRLDNLLPWAPEDPQDVNFVSALTLYGDLNDNLYGATRMKSILLGAIKKEPGTMREAFLQSWGYSDKGYKSVQADDIRQALGWELSPIGNSIFSTLGEIFLDPQNIFEVVATTSKKKTANKSVDIVEKTFKYLDAKVKLQGGVASNDIELLVGEGGIFRLDRHGNFDRAAAMNIAEAYLISGGDYNTFKEALLKMYTLKTKGFNEFVEVQVNTLNEQIAALYKVFQELYTTDINKGSADAKALKENYDKYLKIMNKDPETITAEEHIILDDAKLVISQLKKFYSDQGLDLSETEIIDKFIEDFNLNTTSNVLRTWYITDQNIRHHIDTADAFASAVNLVANPTQTGIRGTLSLMQKAAAKSRSNTSAKKRQKQIDDWENIIADDQKLKTKENVKEAQETRNRRQKDLKDTVNEFSEVNPQAVAEIKAGVQEELVEARREYAEQTTENKKILDYVTAQEKELEEATANTIFIPKIYRFSDNKTIEVTKENAKKLHKEVVVDYETKQGITKENFYERVSSIRKYGNVQEKAELQNYLNTKYAVQEYTYHTTSTKALQSVLAHVRESVMLMDTLTHDVYDEIVNVMTLFNIFKVYYNETGKIGKASDVYKALIKRHQDAKEGLNNEEQTARKKTFQTRHDLRNAKDKLNQAKISFETFVMDVQGNTERKLDPDASVTKEQQDEFAEKLKIFEDAEAEFIKAEKENLAARRALKLAKKAVLTNNTDLEKATTRLNNIAKDTDYLEVTNAVAKLLDIQDTSNFTKDTIKLPTGLTRNKWNNFNETQKKKYIENWISSLSLYNKADASKFNKKREMAKIITAISSFLSKEEDFETSTNVMNQEKYFEIFKEKFQDRNSTFFQTLLKYQLIEEHDGATLLGTQTVGTPKAPLQFKITLNNSITLANTIAHALGISDARTILSGSYKLPNDMTKDKWNNLSLLEKYNYATTWINQLDIYSFADVYKLTQSKYLKRVVHAIGAMLNEPRKTDTIQMNRAMSESMVQAIVYSRIWNGDGGTDKSVKETLTKIINRFALLDEKIASIRTTYENKSLKTRDQFERSVEYLLNITQNLLERSSVFQLIKSARLRNIDRSKIKTSFLFKDDDIYDRYISQEPTKQMLQEVKTKKTTFTEEQIITRLLTSKLNRDSKERLEVILDEIKDSRREATGYTQEKEFIVSQQTLVENTRVQLAELEGTIQASKDTQVVENAKKQKKELEEVLADFGDDIDAELSQRLAEIDKKINDKKERKEKNVAKQKQKKTDATRVEDIKEFVDIALSTVVEAKDASFLGYYDNNNLGTDPYETTPTDINMVLRKDKGYIYMVNKHGNVTFNLRQSSSFLVRNGRPIKKSFTKMLEHFKRTSDGHLEFVYRTMEQIYDLLMERKITINSGQLVVLKKEARDTQKEHFLKRLVETYIQKGQLPITVNVKENIRMNASKQRIIEDAFITWVTNNTNALLTSGKFNPDDFNKDGSLKKQARERLRKDIIGSSDPFYRSVWNGVKLIADKNLTEAIHHEGIIVNNDVHRTLIELSEKLNDYEANDVQALTSHGVQVETEVGLKIMLGDPRLKPFLDDIINFNDKEEMETDFLMYAKKLREAISEDYPEKIHLNFNNIVNVRKEKDEFIFDFVRKDKTTYSLSLFEIMVQGQVNLMSIMDLIKRIPSILGKHTNITADIIQTQTEIRTAATTLADLFGKFISNNYLDINEDVMRHNGATPEEILFIKNEQLSSLYFKYNYGRSKTAFTDATGSQEFAYKNMDKIINEKFIKIRENAYTAYRTGNYKNYEIFQGVENLDDLSFFQVFAFYVMYGEYSVRLTHDERLEFLSQVFFQDVKVSVGKASQTEYDQLKKESAKVNQQLKRTISEHSRRLLTRKKEHIKQQIEALKNNKTRVEHYNLLNNKTKIIEYLMQPENKNLMLSVISNRRNLSSDNYVFVEKPDKTLVLVEKSKLNAANSNVQLVSRGLPNYNNRIIHDILLNPDKVGTNSVEEIVRNSVMWQAITNKDAKVVKGHLGDIFVVVKDKQSLESVLNNQKVFKDSLGMLSYYLELFVVTEDTYRDIVSMQQEFVRTKKPSAIDTHYKYITTETDNTKIIGYVPNILNFKSSAYLFDAYEENVDRIKKFMANNPRYNKIDDVVKDLQKYSDIVENRIYTSKLYGDQKQLQNTKSFRKLQEDAKLLKAVSTFVDLMNIDGGRFNNIQLTTLLKLFMTDAYIKTDVDIATLINEIKEETIKTELTKVVEGRQLKEYLIDAITQMRKEYGESTLNFTNVWKRIFKDDFLNSVKELRDLVVNALKAVEKTNNIVAKKVIPIYLNKREKNITHIPLDTLIDNVALLNKHSPTADDNIINPYGVAESHYFANTIAGYRDFLDKHNAFNERNESTLVFKAREAQELHQKRMDAYKKYPLLKNGIHYRNTWNLIKANDDFLKRIKDLKNKDISAEFLEGLNMSDDAKESLRKYASKLMAYAGDIADEEKMSVLRDHYINILRTTHPSTQEWYEAKDILIDLIQLREYVLEYPRAFQSIESVTAFMVAITLKDFLDNIKKQIGPPDTFLQFQRAYMAVVEKYTNELGSEEKLKEALQDEAFKKKYMEDYQNILKEITDQDSKREYAFTEESLLGSYTLSLGGTTLYKGFNRPGEGFSIAQQNFDVFTLLHRLGASDAVPAGLEKAFTEMIYNANIVLHGETTMPYQLKLDVDLKDPGYSSIREYLEALPERDQMMIRIFMQMRQGRVTVTNEDEQKALEEVLKQADSTSDWTRLFLDPKSNDYKETIKRIRERRRVKETRFKDIKEVFQLSSLKILDDDHEFMDYLKGFLTGKHYIDRSGKLHEIPEDKRTLEVKDFFKYFGIIEKNTINKFTTYRTLRELIFNLNDGEISIKNAFALSMLINNAKKTYLNHKKHLKFWKMAYNEHIVKAPEARARQLRQLNYVAQSDKASIFGADFVQNVYDETNFMFSTRAYLSSYNNKLKRLVFDEERYDTAHSLTPKYISFVEAPIVTTARTIMNATYGHVFKKEERVWKVLNTNLTYRYAFSNSVVDIVAEGVAEDLNSVGSGDVFWQNFRNIFTALLEKIYPEYTPKDFIKMRDVGSALGNLLNNNMSIKFYARQYDIYLENALKTPEAHTLAQEALQAIVDHFDDNDVLLDLNGDTTLIKAVMGKILADKYDAVFKDREAYHAEIKKYAKEYSETKAKITTKQYESISRALSETSSIYDIARVIYKKNFKDLTKEQKETLNNVKNLRDFIVASKTEYKNLYDTLDYMSSERSTIDQRAATADIRLGQRKQEHAQEKNVLAELRQARTKLFKRFSITNLTPSEEYETREKLNQVEHEIANNYARQAKANERIAIEDALDADNLEKFYDELFFSMPELIHSYIEWHNKSLEELITTQDKLSKDMEKVIEDSGGLIKEYQEKVGQIIYLRNEARILQGILDLVISSKAKTAKEAAATLNLFKQELTSFGVKTITDIKKRLKTITTNIDALNIETDALKTKTYADRYGKKRTLEKGLDAYRELEKKYDSQLDKIAFFTEGNPIDFINHPEWETSRYEVLKETFGSAEYRTKRINIVKNFLETIYNMYVSDNKENYKKFLNKKPVDQITKRQRSVNVNKQRGIQAKEKLLHEQALARYLKPLGLIVTGNADNQIKQLENVINTLSNLKPTDAIKERIRKIRRVQRYITSKQRLNAVREETIRAYTSDKIKTVTTKEMITTAVQKVLNDKNIILSDQDIAEVTQRIAEIRAAKKNDARAKAIANKKRLQDTVVKLHARKQSLEKVFVIDSEIDAAETRVNTLGDEINRLEPETIAARDLRIEDRIVTNSNIGTYRKLYNTDLTNDEIIEDVITKSAPYFVGGRQALEDEILKRGEKQLHNDFVDTLITRLNYLKQLEKRGISKPDHYHVLDMETIGTEYGPTPYSITILTETNGVITVTTTRINNSVFFEEPGDYFLDRFYAQQRKLAKKDLEQPLTDAEEKALDIKTDEATTTLVQSIKKQKNAITSMETILYLLKLDKTVPIVAHNGDGFDFPHLENLLKNLARRTLINLYQQEMDGRNPKEIIKTFKETLSGQALDADSTGTLIKILNDNREIIADEFKSGRLVVKDVDKKMVILQQYTDSIFASRVATAIANAEERLGTVDHELKESLLTGENSKLTQLKKHFVDFLLDVSSFDDAKNKIYFLLVDGAVDQHYNKNSKQQLLDEIIKVLNEAKTLYGQLKNNEISIGTFQTKNISAKEAARIEILEEQGIEIKDDGLSPSELIANYRTLIEATDAQIAAIKNTPTDNIQEAIQEQQNRKTALQKDIQDVEDQLRILNNEIQATEELTQNAYDIISTYAQSINETFKRPYYEALRHIKNHYEKFLNRTGKPLQSVLETNVINMEIAKLKEELQEVTLKLRDLTNALIAYQENQSPDNKETLENIMNRSIPISLKDLVEIKTDVQKQAEIARVTKRIEDLEEFLKRFGQGRVEHSNLFKSLSRQALKALEQQKTTTITRIKEAFDKDGIRNFFGKDYTSMMSLLNTSPEEFIEKMNAYKERATRIIEQGPLTNVAKDAKEFQTVLKEMASLHEYLFRLDNFLGIYNNYKDPLILSKTSSFLSLIKNVAITELEDNRFALNILENYTNKKDPLNSLDVINILFNQQLSKLELIEKGEEDSYATGLFGMLVGGAMKSTEMSEKERIFYAAQTLSDDYVKSLDTDYVEVIWDNAQKGDDRYENTLDPDKYYSTSNEDFVTIVVQDLTYRTVQKLIFNRKAPRNVRFEITYAYAEQGEELINPKVVTRTISNYKTTWEDGEEVTTALDMNSQIEALFKEGDENIRGNVSENNLYLIRGIDSPKEAIMNLLRFYNKHQNVFVERGATAKDIQKVIDDTHQDAKLPFKDLISINASLHLKETLMQHLSVLKYAQRGVNFKDAAKVYAGVYNKLLANYKSLIPGKVLNTIPPEFSNNFSIVFDQKSLNEFADNIGIILERSSEGSAAVTTSLRSFYDVVLPFRQNTNTIRTMLSYTKLLSSFTPIEVNNKFFRAQRETGITIEEFLEALPDTTKDGVMKKLLTNSQNPFVPNVLSKEQKYNYDNEILHKIGINLPVAFVNDVRAWEDTILVDKEIALALGWDEGNKSWLGLYGFKGAVKYEEGLYDQYGAVFVANRDSVHSRGAFGAPIEQAMSNIRDYFANKTTMQNDKFNSIKETLTRLDKEITDVFKYNKTTGYGYNPDTKQLLVDPNIDYAKLLNGIEKDLVNKLIRAEYTTVHKDATGKDLTQTKYGYLGSLYVIMDPENVAKNMQNTSELSDTGEENLLIKDFKGTVRRGLVLSPSVVYSIISKGIRNWRDAFEFDTAPLERLAEIAFHGYEGLKNQAGGTINIEELIKENPTAEIFTSLMYSYEHYKSILDSSLQGTSHYNYAAYALERIDQRIRVHAESLLVGRNGQYYNTYYKKHPGIRQQLLANTSFNPGELKTSMEGFMAMVEMKPGFLRKADGTPVSEDTITNLIKKYKEIDKQRTPEGKAVHVYEKSTQLLAYYNSIAELKGAYGNTLLARSPVQDYNAVPMVKIIGFTTHYATEANPYLYKMIGGDNDGDTVGMVPLDSNGSTIFAQDDATQENYYDKEYFSKIKQELTSTESETFKTFAGLDLRYAMVGKRTFAVYKGVPIRNHFTWDELYLKTYENVVKSFIEKIDLTKYNYTMSETDKRIYANVLARSKSSKKSNDFNKDLGLINAESYFDTALIDSIITKYNHENKDFLQKRFVFDRLVDEGKIDVTQFLVNDDIGVYRHNVEKYTRELLVTNTLQDYKDNKQVLEVINFEKIYSMLMTNTLGRVRTSKIGVNIFGGNRKQFLVAAFLSNILDMNRDPDGKIWGQLNLIDTRSKAVTIKSVKEGLIGKTPLNVPADMSFDAFKKTFFVRANAQIHYRLDINNLTLRSDITEEQAARNKLTEDLLELVWLNYRDASATQDRLTDIAEALREKNIKGLATLLETMPYQDTILERSFASHLRKQVDANKDYILTERDELWLSTFLFGRFSRDGIRFIKNASVKDVTDMIATISNTYISQYVITREDLKKLSDDATDIIAVAKHYGFDIDSADALQEFSDDISTVLNAKSVKRVAISEQDHTLAMALAMDRNVFETDYKYKYHSDALKALESRLEDAPKVVIKNTYTDPYVMLNDFRILFRNAAKVELIKDAKMPDTLYEEVESSLQIIFDIFAAANNIDEAIEAVMLHDANPFGVLRAYDVKQYSVMRVLLRGYSLLKAMDDKLYAATSKRASTDKVPLLNTAFNFLEYGFYLYSDAEKRTMELADINQRYPEFVAWLLNTLEDDEVRYTRHSDGTVTRAYGANALPRRNTYTKSDIFNYTERVQTLGGIGDVIGLDESKYNDMFLKEFIKGVRNQIDLERVKEVTTIRDLIDQLRRDNNLIRTTYDYKNEQLKKQQSLKGRTQAEDQADFATSKVFNKYDISADLIGIKENDNLIEDLKRKQSELYSQRYRLLASLAQNEASVEKINNLLKWTKSKATKDNLIKQLEQEKLSMNEKIKNLEEIEHDFVFSETLNNFVRYLTVDNKSIFDINQRNREIRPFTNMDAKKISADHLIGITNRVTPFISLVEFFAIKDAQNNTIDYDWNAMYKYFDSVHQQGRLVIVEEGGDDEGLLIKLNDLVVLQNEAYAKLPKRKARKLRRANYDQEHFKDLNQLKAMQSASDEVRQRVIKVKGLEFAGLAKAGDAPDELNIDLYEKLLPTVTEINLKSPDTLKAIFEYLKTHDVLVGFLYQNDIMDAMNNTYKVFNMNDNVVDKLLSRLLHHSKLFMRLSPGFLLRNFADTWNQLMSNLTDKYGYGVAIHEPMKILDIAKKTHVLLSLYNYLQDERLAIQSMIAGGYEDILRLTPEQKEIPSYQETIETVIKNIYYELVAYEEGVSKITQPNNNIERRYEQSKKHIQELDKIIDMIENKTFDHKGFKIQSLEKYVQFILGMRFAEFYEAQYALANLDKKDQTTLVTNSKAYKRVLKSQEGLKTKEERDNLRQLVTELSYFMETNAQIDIFQKENALYLNDYINKRKQQDAEIGRPLTYEELKADLEEIKSDNEKAKMMWPMLYGLKKFVSKFVPYDMINEYIETSARIASFLYDRHLLNKSINESVSDSLGHWFNYGNRSPLEVNAVIDIPYFSFPARTINNWLDRLQNPRYLRLLSDIMAGVYGQYREEDGTMSNFMKFQIENGWVPITKKFGLRLGNGAFDVYSILNNTGGEILQRRSAPVRFIDELMKGSDFGTIMKQLATVGLIKQGADAVSVFTGRETMKSVPGLDQLVNTRQRALPQNSFNLAYDPGLSRDYKKYTPYKYRYPNNGRYKYYENIYRDWFNKYGRMRKPRVNPYDLVKDIQWKTYVRAQQYRAQMRGL